jgi:hypothetical protein
MNFNEEEMILIILLLTIGKIYIEKCHKKTANYKFDLNKSIFDSKNPEITAIKDGEEKIYPAFPFGMYSSEKEEFIWFYDTDSISSFIQNNRYTYGNYKLYEKLLTPRVNIDEKNYMALVALFVIIIEDLNKNVKNSPYISYNPVLFSDPDKKLEFFILVKLDINCKYNFSTFHTFVDKIEIVQMLRDKELEESKNPSEKLLGYNKFKKKVKVTLIKYTNVLSKKIKKNLHFTFTGNLPKKLSKILTKKLSHLTRKLI